MIEEALLRAAVRLILKETVSVFDEWLSPDVMNVLIQEYASSAPGGEPLRWKYARLRDRVWGEFSARDRTLYINQAKTKNLFKQQVETILHEIQHWNQFVEELSKGGDLMSYNRAYKHESARMGYWKNQFANSTRATSPPRTWRIP